MIFFFLSWLLYLLIIYLFFPHSESQKSGNVNKTCHTYTEQGFFSFFFLQFVKIGERIQIPDSCCMFHCRVQTQKSFAVSLQRQLLITVRTRNCKKVHKHQKIYNISILRVKFQKIIFLSFSTERTKRSNHYDRN